jgi:alpha-L-rhamnosidase
VETYKLSEGAFDYEINPDTKATPVEVEPALAGHFLCRDIPMGTDEDVFPVAVIHRGQVSYSEKEHYYASREICDIGAHYLAYRECELEYASHREFGKCDPHDQVDVQEAPAVISLAADTYADIEFPCNTTGIYEFDLEAEGDGELFIMFDEILLDGEVKPFRMGLSNIITVLAEAGKYHLECAMPHVMKYARIVAKGAAMTVSGLHLHHIAYPMSAINAAFAGDDEDMKRIYAAAIETYRANSVDIYMDCPSRERAGWLCDSFFTSRVEYALTGKSLLERAFLQNFILPESFEFIPKGMLPMCYPSDHYDKTYIPNWAMWYAVELCEYFARTGDREFVEGAKERM